MEHRSTTSPAASICGRRAMFAALAGVAALELSGSAQARDISKLTKALLSAKDYRVRMSAALNLGRSRSSGARSPLEQALQGDKNETVRAGCAAALGRLGVGQALFALRRAQKNDSSPLVRRAAARAIKKLKGRTKVLVKLAKPKLSRGVRDRKLAGNVKEAMRREVTVLKGAELAAAGASNKLPVVQLRAAVLSVAEEADGDTFTAKAKVQVLLRQRAAIKGSLHGSAAAQMNGGGRGLDAHAKHQLRSDAVAAALHSAMRGAGKLLASAGIH